MTAEPAPRSPEVVLLHGPGPVHAGHRPVVALTPTAWRSCTERGVEAVVVDDVIDREPITADRHEYVRWQMDWLERLDRRATARGAARMAALYLTRPVDSVVMLARQLRQLVIALNPSKLTYVGPVSGAQADPYHAGHLQFWPRLGDTPVIAQLLPLVGHLCGIDVGLVAGPGEAALSEPATVASGRGLRRRIGPIVRRMQVVWPGPSRPHGTTLMLWSSGYGAGELGREERRAGRRVLVLERGGVTSQIIGPSPWGLKALGEPIDVVPLAVAGGPAADVVDLLEEVDTWAGVPGAGELLATRTATFTDRLAPVIDRAAEELGVQLRHLGVNRLMAANPSSIEEYAALLAAGRSGTHRVLAQHGDHLFNYDSWLVTETSSFEEMWVSDATVLEDLRHAAIRYGVPLPELKTRSPRVSAIRRKAAGPPPDGRQTVCYVPSVLLGDSWMFDRWRFDDTWYYRWQLRLLDLMASRPEIDFVWKAFPAANQSVDPIPEEIERRGVDNVHYETGPLVPQLLRAHRVFTDFPSTPLYEAVHLGRPVLALTFRCFAEVRSSAAALFAPVLRRCETEEEALAVISAFLDDPAERWLLPSRHVLPT